MKRFAFESVIDNWWNVHEQASFRLLELHKHARPFTRALSNAPRLMLMDHSLI